VSSLRLIALLSGGLDSIVAAWAASQEHFVAAAVTVDYGHRAREREIQAAREVADRLECSHVVVQCPWLGQLSQSALTNPNADIPELNRQQLDDRQATQRSAAAVWVPNRNGMLLNIAATYAEVLDCGGIVCGFNAEEAATFPDNSEPFMRVAGEFFRFATRNAPVVISPTVRLSKSEIVALARKLKAPIGHLWSCYHGGKQHCWKCESCQRLKRALQSAGAWEDWQAGKFDA